MFLIGRAFDAKRAIGVACDGTCFVVAVTDVGTSVVFFDPSVDVLDIKGNGFAQTRNFGMQSAQDVGVQSAQLLKQPEVPGQGCLGVKAVEGSGVEDKIKAHFDDEQGMLEQEATQVSRVAETLTDADKKGFEVGTQRMSGATTRRVVLMVLLFDEGPIEQSKEGAIVRDEGIVLMQGSDGRLVKVNRCK